MSWAKLDDRYDDNRKVKRAWRGHLGAIGLHVMAVTYACRHELDGLIDHAWVEEKLPNKREREQVVRVLLECGLFSERPDGFEVHDFLDFNPSREELEERRERDRVRKASGRGLRGVRGGSARTQLGHDSESDETRVRPRARDGTGRDGTDREEPSSQGEEEIDARAPEQELFAYWQERCNHPTSQPSSERMAKLRARLKDSTEQEIREAIDGAAKAPHISDRGERFDDLELICRTRSKLEMFIKRAALPAFAGKSDDRSARRMEWLRMEGGVAQ